MLYRIYIKRTKIKIISNWGYQKCYYSWKKKGKKDNYIIYYTNDWSSWRCFFDYFFLSNIFFLVLCLCLLLERNSHYTFERKTYNMDERIRHIIYRDLFEDWFIFIFLESGRQEYNSVHVLNRRKAPLLSLKQLV